MSQKRAATLEGETYREQMMEQSETIVRLEEKVILLERRLKEAKMESKRTVVTSLEGQKKDLVDTAEREK